MRGGKYENLYVALEKARAERLIESWEYPIYRADIQKGDDNDIENVVIILESVGAL